MQYPSHGANAQSLYDAMGLNMPEDVLDLSENVNALGIPESIRSAWPNLIQQISIYPHEYAEPFRTLAATSHQLPAQYVLVTNGASEGLTVLAQYFSGQHIVLLEPSFSEYKRTLLRQNCQIDAIVSIDIKSYTFDTAALHERLQTARGCYICNPNNPTGVLLEKSWIEALIAAYPNCTFIIDEAFIDWTDETQSVVPLINQYPNVIVVRSMTKMFAMAGVRLGYLLGQQVEKLRDYLPHWNVSQLAIEMGNICLREQEFTQQSRMSSEKILKDMKQYFDSIHCEYTNSQANYLLFRLPQSFNSDHFFIYLLENGIVLRHTKNYEGLAGKWFRIAVKTEENWLRARKEIDDYVQKHSLLSP